MEQEKPKNTFRDEVEAETGVSIAELLRRDQRVMMLQLLARKKLVELDTEAVETSLEVLNAHLAELQRLPYSEGRDAVVESIKKHKEAAEKNTGRLRFSRVDEVQLATLEMVLAVNGTVPEEIGQGPEKRMPLTPSVAGKVAGPKMGPIKTDEDEDDDDID